MSTASRGSARERQVRKLLESEGWAVTRGAGSKGAADLWAAQAHTETHAWIGQEYDTRPGEFVLRLIQVKGTARGPFAAFSPRERRELASLAKQTGGKAELAWWPPRGELQWFRQGQWPQTA